MLFFFNIQIQLCGSSILCEADHVINECFTGKMNLPNFHPPSLQEHIPECHKSTQFMHNCILHELVYCTGVYDVCSIALKCS